MAGTGTRIAIAACGLAVAGVAAWFALRTSDVPSRVEPTADTPATVASPTKRTRTIDTPSRGAATNYVIAGRVTGLADGVTARVEARRTGECPATVRTDFDDDATRFAAPPRAAPADAAASAGVDGAFALTVAASGTYEVVATLRDGREAVRVVELPDVLPRVEVEISAPAGPNSLRGRVVRADGAPFVGWVRLAEFVEHPTSPEASPPRWTVPGPEGRFEFRGIDAGTCDIEAVVVGESRTTASLIALPQTEALLLTIGEGPLRRGLVVADADGSPIAGARVVTVMKCENAVEHRLTTTDTMGSFAIRGGDIRWVDATAPGFGPGVNTSEKGRNGIDREIVVRLRRCGSVAGRVLRSSDGSPVAGAIVHASVRGWRAPGAPSVASAADGSFRIDGLPPQACEIHVFGGGWASVGLATWSKDENDDDPFRVSVASGGTETCDLRVEPVARIVGRVLGPGGEPLRGVAVGLESGRDNDEGPQWRVPPRTWTVADGTFSFESVAPGEHGWLTADFAGFSTATTSVACSPGQTSEYELRFDVPQRLEVVVLAAESGEPIPNAEIDLAEFTNDGFQVWAGPPHVTGPEGRCVVSDAPPGRLGIVVRAAGFVSTEDSKPVAATPEAADPHRWRVEVRLKRGFVVKGRVFHDDGSPAKQFELGLTRPNEDMPIAGEATDEEGRFRFENVPAGTYTLTTGSRKHLASVVAGGPDVVVRLAPENASGELCKVPVVGPDGAAVPNGDQQHHSDDSSGSGGFTGGALWASRRNDHSVVAVARFMDADGNPLPLGATSVELPFPRPESFEVRVGPERVVSGRVVGPDGRGVARAKLQVRFAAEFLDDEIARVRSQADGSFEIHQLGEGAFRLDIEPPPAFLPCATMTIHGGDRDLVVKLAAAATGVVTVLDWDGKPVRGAVVDVHPENFEDARAHAVTGGDGKARVDGLVPGAPCSIVVTGPANRDDLATWAASPWAPRDTEVRMERGFAIRGVVVDARGKDAEHPRVFIANDAGVTDHVEADAAGRFVILRLHRGETRRLCATRSYGSDLPADPKWTTATAGADEIRLEAQQR